VKFIVIFVIALVLLIPISAFAQKALPDSDNDGIPDISDDCPLDPQNDVDNDGVCGDVDSCPDEYGTQSDGCPAFVHESISFLLKWGSRGSADGQFLSPYGVAVDSSNNVYVADREKNRIQKFSSDGTFLTKWGSSGSADSQFRFPRGVTVDSSGNVYVADTSNHRIQKFSADGTFLTTWGSFGSADGQFKNPRGITVDSSNNVYVADYANSRIQKFLDIPPLPTDSDGDGIIDTSDDCPQDPQNDIDNDGVCGDVDSCPTVYGAQSDGCPAPTPIPAEETEPFTRVTSLGDNSYAVAGTTDMEIDDLIINSGDSVQLDFADDNGGTMEITLPNNLIDNVYSIESSAGAVLFQQVDSDSSSVTIIFDVPTGTDSIRIYGTDVATEPTKSTGSDEPEANGGGCLIATATYGSELAPQVQQLRELRDNSLLQTESGTSFMEPFNDFYYSFSPIIADYERENPVFKEVVKIAITPMISSLSILNYVDIDSEVEVLGYGISLIILNVGMYFVAPVIVFVGIRKKF